MGRFFSIILGLAAVICGTALFIRWRAEFALVLKGALPLLLVFGGAIALIAGVAELKDTISSK